MTVPPPSSRKPEQPVSSKPYPPTSIHSLSNPDIINQNHQQRRAAYQNWANPSSAAKITRQEKNIPFSVASQPLDVSTDFVNSCTIGFPFVELNPTRIASNAGTNLFPAVPVQNPATVSLNTSAARATFSNAQQAPISIAETPAVTLGEGFLEGVVAAPGTSTGHASRFSITNSRAALHSTKSFDRTNPPSSPLSSGSGNINPAKARTTPAVYGLLAKRESGVCHMTYPQHGQPAAPNLPLQQQYAQHNDDNSNAHFNPQQTHNTYHDGNAPYLTSMSQNPSNLSAADNNAIYGTDRNVHSMHNLGSTGTGSSSEHFQQMQLYHEQQQQQQQQQSKLTQELFQRRQAERAARNRESSRRAREKAKHRFRTLEMDNFNLRETVRTLRMQNEYLHAQFERLASIQQACHICRYKTVAIPPPPPRTQSPPLPPGGQNMQQWIVRMT